MKYNRKYIGCNRIGNWVYGGIVSSFNGVFTNEEVLIGTGFDYIPCMIGDISDAYNLLDEKIKNQNIEDIELLMEIVFEVVNEYFGGIDNLNNRMSNYVDLDFITCEDDIGKVSSLKGKGEAACTERAMVTQNLLKKLGIDSYYKCSTIIVNGKNDIHSYNIATINDKHYIVDSSLASVHNEKATSLICEIPDYVYNSLIRGEAGVEDIETYSVLVSHYNPLRDKDIVVEYDKDRTNKYEVQSSRVL